jgi:basic amino acid/polyamine antiporter, APA family
MQHSGEAALVKALGVRQLAAGIVNTTVGAGIFILPALVYQGLGAASPAAFIVCAVAMALIVTAFAVAGSRVTLTGGVYAYVEVAFGPFLGFVAGFLQWAVFLLPGAAVAAALLDQLAVLRPALAGTPQRLAVLAAVLGVLAYINTRGTNVGARAIEALAATKLLTLLLFVAAGVFFVNTDWMAWPGGVPPVDAVGRAVLVLVFAFFGIEVALAPSGEIRDPARTVPRAIYLALTVTAALYIAVQLVAQGLLGPDLGRETQAPIAEATARFLGAAGRTAVLAAAVCSMFGYMCGDMLSSPRNLFAFARDGFLPAVFARIHPVHRTPSVAIWAHAVCMFVIAGSSTFTYLIVAANVGTLALYFLCCAAAAELVRRDVRAGGTPFIIPGARAIPILAAAVILWIVSNATWQEFAATGGILAVAAAVYGVRQLTAPRRALGGETA